MSCGLKITAADGTSNFIPDGYIVSIKQAAGTTVDGIKKQGLITEVIYGTAPTTAGSIAAYASGGILYEYGQMTKYGFSAFISNRKI